MNNFFFARRRQSRPVDHAADAAFSSTRRQAGPKMTSSTVVWACNTNECLGITRKILSLIATFIFMNATTSCSFREGDDSVLIKDGSGEVLLQYPDISSGYYICMTSVGFDVDKSQDDKSVLIIEVENKSDNEMQFYWEGPRFSEGTNDRISGFFLLPHVGSRQSHAFENLPNSLISGKSGLFLAGYDKSLIFILRLKFAKKVNGSVQIHHKGQYP
jgi:hypothetical protein